MRKFVLCLLLVATAMAFGQENPTAAPSSVPASAPLSKKDLMARDKIFYIVSDTFYVKKEEMEKVLLNRQEFEKWDLLVTHNERDADAILLVRRAPFQNNFAYTITDRQNGIVIMAGEVNSLFGTVPGKIAADIVNKLRPIYEPKSNSAKPATP